jgi:hypothetical protein
MKENEEIPEAIKVELSSDEDDDDFDDMDLELLLPSMNVEKSFTPDAKECIIGDKEITGLYDEILDQCRKDREQHDEILANFLDMVMNDGDASSASKEAIVNLLKSKTDISDKMSKIADLKTRIKLKDTDTFPRYLAAQQNNKVVIEGSKRELIKSVAKLKNNKKESK